MLQHKYFSVLYLSSFLLLAEQSRKELPIDKGDCSKVASAIEGVCSKNTPDANNKYWNFIENNYQTISQTYSKVTKTIVCSEFRDFVENACSMNCEYDDCIWKISPEALDLPKDDPSSSPVYETNYQPCMTCGFSKKNEAKTQAEFSSSVGYQDTKKINNLQETPLPPQTKEVERDKILKPETSKDYSPGYMLLGTPSRKKAPIKKY